MVIAGHIQADQAAVPLTNFWGCFIAGKKSNQKRTALKVWRGRGFWKDCRSHVGAGTGTGTGRLLVLSDYYEPINSSDLSPSTEASRSHADVDIKVYNNVEPAPMANPLHTASLARNSDRCIFLFVSFQASC